MSTKMNRNTVNISIICTINAETVRNVHVHGLNKTSDLIFPVAISQSNRFGI